MADTLKARVNKRKRSAFVVAAVREKLEELEQEGLRRNLIEGYRARIEGSIEIDRQREAATQTVIARKAESLTRRSRGREKRV